MPNYRTRQTDREACAIKIVPRDGSIVALAGGPDVIDLGYATLIKTDGEVNAFLSAAVRADVSVLHGVSDDGRESVDHLQEAERAMLAVAKPPVTPMGQLADVRGAYLSDLEDIARQYNGPFSWIEARTKRPCDRVALRLAIPGGLAREIEAAHAAGREADAKAAARAKVQIEHAARPFDGPIPEGQYWVGVEPPREGIRPDIAPHYEDPDGILWHKCALPAGVPCALRSKPGRLILRAGDRAPEGMPTSVMQRASALEMTNETWQENRRALKSARKETTPAARPEPTLKYVALAEEFVAEHVRHVNLMVSPWSYKRTWIAESVVRGLRVPPSAAADLIDRIVGVRRVYGDGGWDRPEIERACVEAWDSSDLASMNWGALIPQGWIDRVGERAMGLLPRMRAWLTGRDRATTPEIVAALGDINDDDPQEHAAILRAAGELGYTKRRVRQPAGHRVQVFVRDGSETPAPKHEGFLFKRSIAECVEPEVI